jgi:polar amino acid transport system ATP-binding protein
VQAPGPLLSAIGGLPGDTAEIVVEATKVRKSFGPAEVLKGVSLTIRRGEVVVIVGPSGSGKTTFIRCLNHLERVQSGRILVNGHLIGYRETGGRMIEDRERNIARQRREIGMVFRRFNLFPHLTALGNIIEAPIQVRRIAKVDAITTARALLARVGLADKADSYPAQLSGGQQQRVAVARAVAGEPLILLADEPTGNLDSTNGEAVMELLRDLHRQGATIIMVTHDPRYARHADRSIHLFDGLIVEDLNQEQAARDEAQLRESGFEVS